MRWILVTATAMIVTTVFAGCGARNAATNYTSPSLIAEAPSRDSVAVAGDNPLELIANIAAARRAKKNVHYVQINTPTGTDVYSVYAQIVKSPTSFIARAYGRIFVYVRKSSSVNMSATRRVQSAVTCFLTFKRQKSTTRFFTERRSV